MGEIVEFPSNGSTAQGYLAVPESGRGIPVVVIQEWWGLVPHIKDVCDRFAAEGFVALAPDLFHGKTTTEPDEAGKLMMAMNLDQAAKDMSGAVDKVAETAGTDRVGVTGFCVGGALALILASRRPDKIKAAVPWYGLFAWPNSEPDWSTLDAAVLGHYAEKDTYFTPDLAEQMEQNMRAAGLDAQVHVVPGADHAFFNDTRP
ncbi:MAG TPA: dienelactone hydrolase family protein, partial [Acidimicrobiales bacterium]|nr:dienelactone hydrolase family protein [Acidimicrobiales bacterium]